jgi:hypothetical protein
MFATHRRGRARVSLLFAVILALAGVSCARGSQAVEGSPFDTVAPVASVASAQGDSSVATGPSSPYAATEDAGAPTGATDDADIDAWDEADDDPDAGGDDAGDAAPTVDSFPPTPAPGELAITEVMLSPSGPEPESEWFEIYNLASSGRSLAGLVIEDGYGDTDVITPTAAVVVPPATYALLVRDQATAAQTLLPVSSIVYAYGEGLAASEGIELDDGTAGDLSLWNGSALLADVPYGMWDASWIGQSIELSTPQSDATDPSKWCVAQSPWAPGSDDGTPGAPSDCGF